jgi:hypothetical protein
MADAKHTPTHPTAPNIIRAQKLCVTVRMARWKKGQKKFVFGRLKPSGKEMYHLL